MISKCIALLLAAPMLANCCGFGNGCAPQAGTPIAWDGLGAAPAEDAKPLELQPSQHGRTKREISLGPHDTAAAERGSKLQPKDSWDRQQAADQEEETRLKRKLLICSTCLGESARAEPAGSAAR